MKNLIKAQLYQICRTRVYLWLFVVFVGMAIFVGSAEYLSGKDFLEEGQQLTASDYATRMGGSNIFVVIGMAFFTGFICANDFSDKTCNYELMSGRMRWQSYLARAAVSVIVSVLFGMLLLAVALITSTLLNGWGNSITVGTVVGRILLMAFPFFRLSCLFVLLSYVLKRPIFVAAVGYGMLSVFAMLSETSTITTEVITAFTNISMLSQYDMWISYGLESGTYIVYDATLGAMKVFQTIAVSLVAGGFYLALGYGYFHGDDLE